MDPMRTTIELKADYRAKLLELAARRGEKGFSSVVAEAIERYLATDADTERRREKALRLRGALSLTEARRLAHDASGLRDFWR
jgi:metal-responsive CopG/Arc/MetJ family transcriptional regulator